MTDGVAEPKVDYTTEFGLVAEKEKIAEGGEYNLSGDRYRVSALTNSEWPMVELGEVCQIINGSTPSRREERFWEEAHIPWFTIEDIRKLGRRITATKQHVSQAALDETSLRLLPKKAVLLCCAASVGEYAIAEIPLTTNQQFNGLVIKESYSTILIPDFLLFLASQLKSELIRLSGKTSFNFVSGRTLKKIQIPLPPLEVQREIVAEIEGYQRVIDGARAVIDNYRPQIVVDSEWPMVAIGEVCNLINGRAFKPQDWKLADSGGLPIVRIQNLNAPDSDFNYYTGEVQDRYLINQGQLLFSWSGSRGTSFGAHIWNGGKAILNQHIFKVEFDRIRATKMYLLYALNRAVAEVEQNLHGGVGLVHITKGNLEKIQIPLPSMTTQQAIVAEIEAKQSLVSANRELVERMEGKIRAAIGQVWGDE